MIKSKFLMGAILVAPVLGIVSCQQKNNGEMVTVNLDGNEGMFVSTGTYKTLSVVKGSSLGSILDELPMVKAEDFSPTNGSSDTLTPARWIDDEGNNVSLDYRINSDATFHACYYSSIEKARSAAIASMSIQLFDACERQPEAIEKITEVYNSIVEDALLANNEASLFGIKELADSELSVFASNPEAIDFIVENVDPYFQAAKDLTYSLAYGIGCIGGSAADAFRRASNPEKIVLTTEPIVKETKLMPQHCGNEFRGFGRTLMDLCGTRPEDVDTILENVKVIFNGFKRTKNSFQAVCISKVGQEWANQCRFVETSVMSKLTDLAADAIDKILAN